MGKDKLDNKAYQAPFVYKNFATHVFWPAVLKINSANRIFPK